MTSRTVVTMSLVTLVLSVIVVGLTFYSWSAGETDPFLDIIGITASVSVVLSSWNIWKLK